MATNDYIINFSDPAKTPFVIKPFTTNGPIAPNNAGLPTTSVAANTTLLLPGKGLFEYGEFTDENLIHMMEHFAGPTEPVFPIQGQLWFKNDTADLYVCSDPTQVLFVNRWKKLIVSGLITGDLDMNNFKITNLANATNPQDALNMQTGDSRYVNVTGDTMSGVLNMGTNRISNVAAPVSSGDAVNKLYADALVGGGPFLSLAGGTMTGSINVGDGGANTNKLYNFFADVSDPTSAVSISAGDGRYVRSAPAGTQTMTGTYAVNGSDLTLSAGNVLFGPGLVINAGGNKIVNLVDPVNAQDAATKAYVDAAVGGGGSSFGEVSINRRLHVGDGTTATFGISPFSYRSGTNQMAVYVNGVKQIASQYAIQYIQLTGLTDFSAITPLAPTTSYEFRLQVDGGAVTPVPFTTGAGTTTYAALLTLINNAIITAFGSAVARAYGQVQLYANAMFIEIGSATQGTGSQITIQDGVGPTPLPLIAALAPALITPVTGTGIDTPVSTNYSYTEDAGNVFFFSSSVTFYTPPSLGEVVELVVTSQ